MKDARGHGSDGRGGSSASDYLKRSGIGVAGNFSGRKLNPNLTPTAGQHTVNDLRNRLSNAAGPGHARALLQGIRNLVGA